MNPKTTLITVIIVIAVVAVAVSALILTGILFPPLAEVHRYSFEEGMEGWAAAGLDLEHDGGTIQWSIERSQERATEGDTSLKFFMDNVNDAGKIWIERGFAVESGRTYSVSVRYAFASADFGSFNLWTIIAGAMPTKPETRDDLQPAFQDDTGNGMDSDSGYLWLEKTYGFNVNPGSDGMLWVIIGVWGTWETPRAYFIDDVEVTIRPA